MTGNPFEVKGFNPGDKVFLIDLDTGIKSQKGRIFQIDMGEIIVRFDNGCEVNIDGSTLQGKTPFGPCRISK